MQGKPLVSVVIPAWNEANYIEASLRALLAAVKRLECAGVVSEIIVVDNASTDDTARRAAALGARVVTEGRRCIAAVRNRGAREASGDFLVFIDADSLASANSLERIWATLSSGRYVGGGVVIRPDRWVLSAAPLYALGPLMRVLLGVSAGMIFATREAFEAAGGFDESVYAAEDLEFIRALKSWGRKCGKKFANLTDVHITTSMRKFGKVTLSDWLIFPKYLFNRASVRRIDNCRFWYGERYR